MKEANHMDVGFQFEVIYEDVHLIEVRISAWNGSFGGIADVYMGIEQLEETAAKLQGFPNAASDVREVKLGPFDSKSASGRRVSMRFYCADESGHAFVDATIESAKNSSGKIQSATLLLPVEAAAVDSFVLELYRIAAEKTGTARLKGRPG